MKTEKNTTEETKENDSTKLANEIHIPFLLKITIYFSFFMLVCLSYNSFTVLNTRNKINMLDIHSGTSSLASKLNPATISIVENAEVALNLARKHIQAEEYETGRVYLINAINHNPSNIKYLSELMVLFRKHYSSEHNVLREVRSIVELSLFQLDPNEVENALRFLEELNTSEQKLLSSQESNTNHANAINYQKEYDSLQDIDKYSLFSNPIQLNRYREELSGLLSVVQEVQDKEKYADLIMSIEKEIADTSNLYNISLIAQRIDHYIELLNKETDYSSRSASARLIAASTAMTLFWEYDFTSIPTNLTNLIQHDIPNQLEEYEKRIKKAKSIPYYEEAKKILDEALNNNTGTNQSKIETIHMAIETAAKLMTNVLFVEYKTTIGNLIKSFQNKVVSLKRNQYIAYQKWAARICSRTFDRIHEEKSIKSLKSYTDSDAIRIFKQSSIYKIDLRLTSPEVSQAYNKVFEKIVGELPADKAFECHKFVMTSSKKSLEDF